MSLVHFNFESQYLHGNTDVNIILPDKPREINSKAFYGSGEKYKVLWLLHGTFGDYSDWIRKSNIELYACERNLAVVMPSALNSDYADWPNFSIGYDAYHYFFDELMPIMYNWFPISNKQKDNYISGLSMGGWGTCVYAFNHPEKFAGMAALSGVPFNARKAIEQKNELAEGRIEGSVKNAGGLDAYLSSPYNIWDLTAKVARSKRSIKMYFSCGDQDPIMYKHYLEFKKYADEIGLNATFEEIQGYSHEWRFWDKSIQKTLDFFDIKLSQPAGNAF
jgi:putative tributyrin esterase